MSPVTQRCAFVQVSYSCNEHSVICCMPSGLLRKLPDKFVAPPPSEVLTIPQRKIISVKMMNDIFEYITFK